MEGVPLVPSGYRLLRAYKNAVKSLHCTRQHRTAKNYPAQTASCASCENSHYTMIFNSCIVLGH